MTKFTKEQLIEHIREMMESSKEMIDGNGVPVEFVVRAERDIAVYEIALAAMTAPQLPQPAVVPDAIEIDDDFDSAFEHGKAVGWNAYRAAMLQGAEPVCQSYTLRDGWVAVPVEPTPEMMREVQINSELGAYASANLSGAYSLFREFWDVAIAAAPQQEVDNG